MTTFDLKRIMSDYSLKEKEMAYIMFPDNKFPEVALRRAIEGQTKITVDQAIALASYLGEPIYKLFTDGGWYSVPDKQYSILRKGDITALLRSNSIAIRDKYTGVEHYIVRPECITAKDIIEMLNKELAKELL